MFFLLNPFLLLDIDHAAHDISSEISHYAGGHPGATVDRGLPHLAATLGGLADDLGPALSALAIIGVVAGLRRNLRATVILVGVPGIHLLFMSLQRVQILRNVLAMLPVLAIFSALGLVAVLRPLWGISPFRGLSVRRIAAVALAALALTSGGIDRLRAIYDLEVESRNTLSETIDSLDRSPTEVLVARELRLAPDAIGRLRSARKTTVFDALVLPPVLTAHLVATLEEGERAGVLTIYEPRADGSAYIRRKGIGARELAGALDRLAPRLVSLLADRIRQTPRESVVVLPRFTTDPRWPEGQVFAAVWNDAVASFGEVTQLGRYPLRINYPYGPPSHLGDPLLAIVGGGGRPEPAGV
jgi:hypothetical protein